jgi:hypothetical protein
MRRFGVFWGLFLVLLGGLILAVNFGVLPPLTWNLLWPLALVALGAWIVIGAFVRPRSAEGQRVSVPLEGAQAARVIVRHGAGRLDVSGGAAPDELFSGDFVGLRHRESVSGSGVVADLSLDEDWPRWERGATGLDWSLRLTEAIPVALELHVGASDNRLDLTRVRLAELQLETGASSTVVALPAGVGLTKVGLKTGAASVRVTVPPNVAARVTAHGALATFDVDAARFPRVGDVWESPGFDTATDRVEITAEAGVGSISVR